VMSASACALRRGATPAGGGCACRAVLEGVAEARSWEPADGCAQGGAGGCTLQ
jgi:hypothetical protein